MKKRQKMTYLQMKFSQSLKHVKIRLGYQKTSIFIKEFKFVIFGLIGLLLVYIKPKMYRFIFVFFGLISNFLHIVGFANSVAH